ncbi:unnamed protein product [Parascedosporium putredinis]|uniref:Chitin-binding type-1 domain-containing protein n=1 Tax=Parascedosporium putredinis TaxID=1442378 RepID=A0A9P1MAB5_9PEZI|nr:unnamed protein product [Parascedosporium putredinis]CAI7996303.1 unnamed protein product [Parascedosporium putredinis]
MRSRSFAFGSLLLCAATTASAGLFAQLDLDSNPLSRRQIAVSLDGNCGLIKGVLTTCQGSAEGDCCSRLGFCGGNSSYCGDGCQTRFGTCGDANISTDGTCGGAKGLSCIGFSLGNCCSERGFAAATTPTAARAASPSLASAAPSPARRPRLPRRPGIGSRPRPRVPARTGTVSTPDSGTDGPDSGTDGADQSSVNGDSVDTNTGGGTSNALKIGLGVGISAGVLVILAIVALLFRRRRRQAGPSVPEKDATPREMYELESPVKAAELVGTQQEVVELPAVSYNR